MRIICCAHSQTPPALVDEQLEDIDDLLKREQLLHEVASGQFYHDHAGHFNEKQAVDEFLLKNLADARDKLLSDPQKIKSEGQRTSSAHRSQRKR